MNRLNYSLVVFLVLLIVSSVFIKPKSFSKYFDLNINATIPKEPISKNTERENKIPFDIDSFNAAIEDQETESITSMEGLPSWTILVEEYEDKVNLIADFKILKERGLKAYIQYKENEENKFILFIGPTIDRDDSRENLKKISDLIKFSPKIIPYD